MKVDRNGNEWVGLWVWKPLAEWNDMRTAEKCNTKMHIKVNERVCLWVGTPLSLLQVDVESTMDR